MGDVIRGFRWFLFSFYLSGFYLIIYLCVCVKFYGVHYFIGVLGVHLCSQISLLQ